MSQTLSKPTFEKTTYYDVETDLQLVTNLPLIPCDEKPLKNISLYQIDPSSQVICPYYFATDENCLWIIPAENVHDAIQSFLEDKRVSFILNNQHELLLLLRTLGGA